MDRQEIREKLQLNKNLFGEFLYLLFPEGGPDYCNPDFLVSDESQARTGGVFTGSVAWPTEEAIQAAFSEALAVYPEVSEEEKEVRDLRRAEYERQGLTFDRWAELSIEGDSAEIARFKNKRNKIKQKYPKP